MPINWQRYLIRKEENETEFVSYTNILRPLTFTTNSYFLVIQYVIIKCRPLNRTLRLSPEKAREWKLKPKHKITESSSNDIVKRPLNSSSRVPRANATIPSSSALDPLIVISACTYKRRPYTERGRGGHGAINVPQWTRPREGVGERENERDRERCAGSGDELHCFATPISRGLIGGKFAERNCAHQCHHSRADAFNLRLDDEKKWGCSVVVTALFSSLRALAMTVLYKRLEYRGISADRAGPSLKKLRLDPSSRRG